MPKPAVSTREGRAILARPSLCFLLVLLFFAAALAFVASAAQAVPTPLLTGTDPESSSASPAESTEPLILGEGEATIITQGIPRVFGPRTSATKHPEYEIEIFANGSCQGSPMKTGNAGELESPGIPAIAAEDQMSVFSARQIDPGDPTHPSTCSAPLKYWQGDPPPEEETPGGGGPTDPPPGGPGPQPGSPPVRPGPPHLRLVPGARANQNAPRLTGTAPGADAVRLFAGPGCNGSPLAKVSPAELAAGVPVQVADNSTTSFSAVALAGGEQSPCSTTVTYIEDSAAPRTRITMGPGVKTRRRKAIFRFADISGDPPGATFLCKVDRKKWKPCTSPFKVRSLGFRRHSLRVRAVDLAGNAETKPAKRSFKVVRAP